MRLPPQLEHFTLGTLVAELEETVRGVLEDGEAAPAEAPDVQRSPAAQDPQWSEDPGNEQHAGAQQEEELPGLPSGVQKEVEIDHIEIEQKGANCLLFRRQWLTPYRL